MYHNNIIINVIYYVKFNKLPKLICSCMCCNAWTHTTGRT